MTSMRWIIQIWGIIGCFDVAVFEEWRWLMLFAVFYRYLPNANSRMTVDNAFVLVQKVLIAVRHFCKNYLVCAQNQLIFELIRTIPFCRGKNNFTHWSKYARFFLSLRFWCPELVTLHSVQVSLWSTDFYGAFKSHKSLLWLIGLVLHNTF